MFHVFQGFALGFCAFGFRGHGAWMFRVCWPAPPIWDPERLGAASCRINLSTGMVAPLQVLAIGVLGVLGGSWVVISRVTGPLIWVMIIVTLLITPLISRGGDPGYVRERDGPGSRVVLTCSY